jgi:hypothetical protein
MVCRIALVAALVVGCSSDPSPAPTTTTTPPELAGVWKLSGGDAGGDTWLVFYPGGYLWSKDVSPVTRGCHGCEEWQQVDASTLRFVCGGAPYTAQIELTRDDVGPKLTFKSDLTNYPVKANDTFRYESNDPKTVEPICTQ